jgi:predicted ATP-dependent endonuclease of OLD family
MESQTPQEPPAAAAAAEPNVDFAEIFVERVRVQNFRGLDDCSVDLEPDLTLLVGANNSGKSRILRALGVALGAVSAAGDDLTVGGPDTATIDVVFAPRVHAGLPEEFDARVRRRLIDVQPVGTDPIRERFDLTPRSWST